MFVCLIYLPYLCAVNLKFTKQISKFTDRYFYMIAKEKIEKILESPRTPLMRQVELTADERVELRDALNAKGNFNSTKVRF